MKVKVLSLLLSFLILPVLFFSCSSDDVEPQKELRANQDIILVLDTSLSMIGKAKGARDIFPQVKERTARFIDTVSTGDTFTFITFDTEPRVYPTIKVKNESDLNVIKSFVSQVEAKGQWTFTMEMFRDVLKKADEIRRLNLLEKSKAEEEGVEFNERKQIVIILSDALDDPPPSQKSERLSVKDVASEHTGEDWFVYFVSLGQLTDNEKLQALQDELSSDTSATVGVLNASSDVGDGFSTIEQETKERKSDISGSSRPVYKAAWFYLILIFLVILAIGIIYAIHSARIKLSGMLEYRNKVVLGSKFQKINLERYDSRRINIGKDSLCELRLADFETHLPVCLEAALVKGELFVFVNTDRGIKVQITEGKGDPYLSDGAVFEAGGYLFRYVTRK
ncbi:MAG TPA: VWA domain-containing protein [Spirochaetota bacterium]|nr:VWA domain-containing protein [Spirochaetota bacterium]